MKHHHAPAARLGGLLLALLLSVHVASAQAPLSAVPGIRVAVGPQVTTLGVGVGASVRFARLFGVSAEYHLTPGIPDYDRSGFGHTLTFDNAISGGMLLATLHPTGGAFAIGAGLLFGGVTSDGLLDLDPSGGASIDLNDRTYPVSQVGNLTSDFEFGGVLPVLVIGRMGSGLNIALGAALGKPSLVLEADGPAASDPTFRRDLDAEIEDIQEDLDKIPVYPYLRIGWRFAL